MNPRSFLQREKRRGEQNKIANRPILLVTYVITGIFLLMIGYICKFMIVDSQTVIANSYNTRQDKLAERVIRGDIVSGDGVVLATNQYADDGSYTRYYPYGNMYAHAVGYDKYGKSGVELTANYYLLTSNANIFERTVKALQEEKNMGDTIVTTLDTRLQTAAYNALGEGRGAVVVMEPDTGKVLAMVSKPDFDPNNIDDVWQAVSDGTAWDNSILLNRATQGLYPPGSYRELTLLQPERLRKLNEKKKKSSSPVNPRSFLQREKRRGEQNKIANRPILLVTYVITGIFLLMIGYICKFMIVDSQTVIANSYNTRQDKLAERVIRGDIVSGDGVVLATNQYADDGSYTRYYPYGNMYAHAVGYDKYGKSGVELTANYYLLTSNANIFERTVKALQEEKNMGDTIVTTLDTRLQTAAYNALGEGRGAVVVMEPDTGKVLAMVSKPDFDPNNIDDVWQAVSDGTAWDNSILLNRATQGLYPPGSTFKVLTALEYMRENSNWEGYHFNCQGEDTFNNVTIHCYNSTVHGEVSLADSVAYSCNTSFANIGTTLNMDSFHKLCEDFLFNQNLPYGGTYTKSSFVLNGSSDKSLIPQTVIGQGDTQISPLHNALIMSTMANGGVMMKPYLVDSIENYQGVNVKRFSPSAYKRIISADEAAQMTELMKGVITYGTGSVLNTDAYTVAGKTGTAEYNSEGKSHSWFVGFSNVENPDIVVSVVIEDADTSGIRAVNVAKQIFDAYYQ